MWKMRNAKRCEATLAELEKEKINETEEKEEKEA